MNAPSYHKVLADLARHLLRWRLLTALTGCLFAFLGFMVIFQLAVYFLPMREAVTVNLFAIIALSCLILVGLSIWRVFRVQPGMPALANRIEQHNPELYDHLNCATDISLQGKQNLSAMEQLVVTKADNALKAINVYQGVGYHRDQKYGLLIALLVCSVLLGSLGQWPISQNLLHALKDRISGENTGLSVEPGSAEFSEHSDITVSAFIHRGLKQASIEYRLGDTLSQASMYSVDDRQDQGDYTFFDATQPIDYRVKTADFSSEWYHLSIYKLPSIDKVSWRIQPPAYTQLPEALLTGVKHAAVPEGSRIVSEVAASNGLSVEMVTQYKTLPLLYNGKLYRKDWSPKANSASVDSKDDIVVYFRAEDKDGHSVQSDPTTIDIVIDEKPVLEIVSPGVDVSLKKDEIAPLELYLADDYGLSKASLNVIVKRNKKNIAITLRKGEKNQRHHLSLDVAKYSVKPGDLISYYLTATDNKRPQAQVAKSEIFFIEINAKDDKSENLTQDGEAPGSDTDKKELPIREFIIETKKIIRHSFAITDSDDKNAESLALQDIAQDTLVLKRTMNKVYVKNKAAFKIIDNIDSGNLLLEAVRALERSIVELNRQALQISIDNSSQALQKLVQLDSLFKRLARSSGMKQGAGGKEGKNGASTGEIAKPSSYEKRIEKMTAIKRALQKTREIIERQQHVNIKIENAERLHSDIQLALAKSQQDIEKQTEALSQSLYNATGKLGVVTILNQAQENMHASSGFLTNKQAALASAQGVRALDSLQMAAVNLKRELYQLADEALEWTKQRGERLAQQQNSAIKKTRLKDEQIKSEQLQREQQSINTSIGQFSTDMQQTSTLLRGLNESIGQTLDALNNGEQRKAMERHQDRAVNALLYELFDQAEGEQQKIYQSLQQLTSGIGNVQQLLASEKGNVLASAVQNMDEVLKKIEKMSAKNLQASARQLAGKLQGGNMNASDFRLQEALQLFDELGNRKDTEYLKQDMQWALQRTKPALQAYLWQKAINRSIQQSQKDTQLPQQYKRAIEDYFRRLAEGSNKE